MGDERVKRRLTAILAADVAGYSRLMSIDEADTVAALDAARTVFRRQIELNQGRVIDMAGDSVLAVFDIASGAVAAALAVQAELGELNHVVPKDRRMLFRIGIHLGDVIEKFDGSVYGDGVNVAARLEGLSHPGGVTVSDIVYGAVRDRIPVRFDDAGEFEAKNIARPVHAYHARTGLNEIDAEYLKSYDSGAAAISTTDSSAVVLKPAIVVLPFSNLSGDAQYDFIGDGLCEDLTTALAAVRVYRVIARTSTLQYRGTAPHTRQVAVDLGAAFIVSGSFQKLGSRIRVSAQLVNATTESQLWAERYECTYDDLFKLQDDVVQTIIGRLEPELDLAGYAKERSAPAENLSAWELYHRAMILVAERELNSTIEARKLFRNVVNLDPNFGRAYAAITQTYAHAAVVEPDEFDLAEMLGAARQAVACDSQDYWSYTALGLALQFARDGPGALQAYETAVGLNPHNAATRAWYGEALTGVGDAAKAVEQLELAIRLSPCDPWVGPFYGRLCRAYYFLAQYEKAISAASTAFQYAHAWPVHATNCAALTHLGRRAEAKAALAGLLDKQPRISGAFIRKHLPILHQPYMNQLIDDLTVAGLKE
ncbi:MAG: adenylate/guanylate cyclase domain-containing protein [Burkholderiaceae bacterium]